MYADVEQAIMQLYSRTGEALLEGLLRVSSSALANTIKGFGDNARILVGTGALLLLLLEPDKALLALCI